MKATIRLSSARLNAANFFQAEVVASSAGVQCIPPEHPTGLCGLTLVQSVSTVTFVGIAGTAALTTTLLLDQFEWFNVSAHAI